MLGLRLKVIERTPIAELGWLGVPDPPFGISEEPGAYTYYIDNQDPNATDSGNPNGSVAVPRLTIPSTFSAGAVVEVHGGPYNYSSDWSWTVSGTSGSPIFFKGVGNPQLGSTSASLHSFGLSGSYAIIDGFAFDKTQFIFDGDHLVFRHGSLTNFTPTSNDAAITASSSSYIVIYDCHVHHNGDSEQEAEVDIHGIKFSTGNSYWWIVGNEFDHHGGDDIQLGDAEAQTQEPWATHIFFAGNNCHDSRENCVDLKASRNIIVSQNTLHHNEPTSTSEGASVVVHYGAENIWILANTIHTASYGISLTSDISEPIYVVGNVIYDILHVDPSYDPSNVYADGQAITIRGNANVKIVNNTIDDCDAGVCHQQTSISLTVENNIFGNIFQSAAHHLRTVSGCTGVVEQCLFKQTAVIKWTQTGAQTVSQFAASYPNVEKDCIDVASVGFSDENNRDYSLAAGSAAINAGTESSVYATYQANYGVNIRYDRDGNPRPATSGDWDIGAYERQ